MRYLSSLSDDCFNPHTLRGVRFSHGGRMSVLQVISIPTPLTGCDHFDAQPEFNLSVSIPTPLAGCDAIARILNDRGIPFQSPHPSRGAIFFFCFAEAGFVVSIPTPLTGCDHNGFIKEITGGVSIPTPLTGCDSKTPQYRKI